jgi:hypothetical protein
MNGASPAALLTNAVWARLCRLARNGGLGWGMEPTEWAWRAARQVAGRWSGVFGGWGGPGSSHRGPGWAGTDSEALRPTGRRSGASLQGGSFLSIIAEWRSSGKTGGDGQGAPDPLRWARAGHGFPSCGGLSAEDSAMGR